MFVDCRLLPIFGLFVKSLRADSGRPRIHWGPQTKVVGLEGHLTTVDVKDDLARCMLFAGAVTILLINQ